LKAGINQLLTQDERPGSGFVQAGIDLMVMSRHVQSPNLETSNRSITEVVMCKHRNPPVGSMQLLFERSFACFRNPAPEAVKEG